MAEPADGRGADPVTDVGAAAALAGLWRLAGLPDEALGEADLPGDGPVLPSSFAVATAAQSSLAAAALAAAELWQGRQGRRQRVCVPREAAAMECTGLFQIDGRTPPAWDPLSGLYRCGESAGQPGWVRLHANFAHHRDGALRLLGLPVGPTTPREAVADALRHWTAEGFETAAAEAAGVVAALRTRGHWLSHPQAAVVQAQPVVKWQRLGDAPPLAWAVGDAASPPLSGLRVLDFTRILAGPVCGRTLAAYGADVMLVNGPHLPNIDAIADTSRGKLSAQLDLRQADDAARLTTLVQGAEVFLQAYRPGSLAARGWSAEQLVALRPGLVVVSLSAYGSEGPWGGRRGFDSLVQTATGFNQDEAEAAGSAEPRALPVQILDYAAGYLMAFGAQAALWRQAREGGSWQVEVSLAGVGEWLRRLGRVPGGLAVPKPALMDRLLTEPSGFGPLAVLPHAARFSVSSLAKRRPAMPPGSHPPAWPPG